MQVSRQATVSKQFLKLLLVKYIFNSKCNYLVSLHYLFLMCLTQFASCLQNWYAMTPLGQKRIKAATGKETKASTKGKVAKKKKKK